MLQSIRRGWFRYLGGCCFENINNLIITVISDDPSNLFSHGILTYIAVIDYKVAKLGPLDTSLYFKLKHQIAYNDFI